jgi:hypothetical protein
LYFCHILIIGITNADEFALFIEEEKTFEDYDEEEAEKQKTNTIRRVVSNTMS